MENNSFFGRSGTIQNLMNFAGLYRPSNNSQGQRSSFGALGSLVKLVMSLVS